MEVDSASPLAPLTASPAEHRLRRLLSAVALAAGTLLFAFGVDPAGAELASDAEPTWGVSGQLDSASNNFAAEVWDFAQRGDVMYAGGKFTTAVSGPGGRTVPRNALAAFDSRNGTLIESFDPDVRGGAVYAVELSPDGSRLFIAGEFTSVEGVDNTAGLAALDPVTGALDPTWRAGLERPWTDAPPVGRALDVSGPWLYVGGNFTHIDAGTVRRQLSRVGRVSLATGEPDAAFAPQVAGGGVWDIEPSVDGSRLYLAGFFSTVNGDATYGDRFAAVQTSNGQLVPGVAPFEPNLDRTGRQYAIAVTNDLVFVGGEEHMLQVLDGQTLERRQLYFGGSPSFLAASPLYGGGDFQVLETVGDRVYAGCHCWNYLLESSQGPTLFPTNVFSPGTWTPIRSVAAFDGASGDRLDDVQFDLSGAGGAWALRGATDGCLWVGGDITQSGGKWLSGIGRFCDESVATDTERPTTPKGLKATATAEGIELSWTTSSDNIGVTGYEVRRSTDGTVGPVIATVALPSYLDASTVATEIYTYAITAIDNGGNRSWRSNFATIQETTSVDTERPSPPQGLVVDSVAAAEVVLSWKPSTDNVGVSRYIVFRSEAGATAVEVGRSSTTAFSDATVVAGKNYTYTVKAIDAAANTSWRSNTAVASTKAASTDAERPSTPKGLNGLATGGTVVLTWTSATDNVGVTGYEIYRSTDGTVGSFLATSPTSSFTDVGVEVGVAYTYTVKAFDEAGNVSWRSNLTTINS
ncbi:MAG: hypothetical protein R2733_26490 [Acidimicrobiales bacterium]